MNKINLKKIKIDETLKIILKVENIINCEYGITETLDSLKHMELMSRLERELEIELTEEQMVGMVSTAKIYEILLKDED